MPCVEPPKITPRNVQIWTAGPLGRLLLGPGTFGGAMFDTIQLEISPSSVPFRPQLSQPAAAKF